MIRIERGQQVQINPRVEIEQPTRSNCAEKTNNAAQFVFVVLGTMAFLSGLFQNRNHFTDRYYSGYKDIPANQAEGFYDYTIIYPAATLIALNVLSCAVNTFCQQRAGRTSPAAIYPTATFLGTLIAFSTLNYHLTRAQNFNNFVSEYNHHPEHFSCLNTITENIQQFFDPSVCRLELNRTGICYEDTQYYIGCIPETETLPLINTPFDTLVCNNWSQVNETAKAVWHKYGMVPPMEMIADEVPHQSNLDISLKCYHQKIHFSRVKFFEHHLCTARKLTIDPIISKCATKQFFEYYNNYLKALEENHIAPKRASKLFMKWITQSGDDTLRKNFIQAATAAISGTLSYYQFT